MATYYWGVGGNDSTGDGTEGAPFLTYGFAIASSADGDELITLPGVNQHPTSFYDFANDRDIDGEEGAVLTANGVQSVVAQVLSGANRTNAISNITFDTLYDGANDAPDTALRIRLQANSELTATNVSLRSGKRYALAMEDRSGTYQFIDMTVSGYPGVKPMIGGTESLSANGDQSISFDGLSFTTDAPVNSSSSQLIVLKQDGTNGNDLAVSFNNPVINVEVGASGSTNIIYLNGATNASIVDPDITIKGLADGANASGILFKGVDATTPIAYAEIIGGKTAFDVNNGYGVMFGQPSVGDSFVVDSLLKNHAVVGKFNPTATPHNVTVGEGATTTIDGGSSKWGGVGYMFSINDGLTTLNSPVAYDNNYCSFYFKGSQGGTLTGGIAVLSKNGPSKVQQRGVFSFVHQVDDNNTKNIGSGMSGCSAYVSDISSTLALNHIESADHDVTISNTTYYIADTVDTDTALLFSYHNGETGPSNQTLAQWNANPEVTNDTIVLMSQASLDKKISELDPDYTPPIGNTMNNNLPLATALHPGVVDNTTPGVNSGMNSGSSAPGIGIDTGQYSADDPYFVEVTPKSGYIGFGGANTTSGQTTQVDLLAVQYATATFDKKVKFVKTTTETAAGGEIGSTGFLNMTGVTVPTDVWLWGVESA